jgi:hypothetical protein
MNAPTSPSDQRRKEHRGARCWLLVVAVLISLAAISRQSLWIDEALTARKAQQPTLAGWWHALVEEKASDLQMPLYMIYVWGYEKVFGSSEWMLRAANLPWFALGLLAVITALSSSNQPAPAFALVVCGSPFAWYCLNEARPYAMQLGASLLLFAALGRLRVQPAANGTNERSWMTGFFFGMMVLCGSSLLGMIWAVSALAAAAIVFPRNRLTELWRSHRGSGAAIGGLLLLLGVYYAWTLAAGARASRAATTDWKNLCFIGYELLGFSGLGPGRLEIRQGGLEVFQSHAIELGLYGVTVFGLLGAGARRWFEAGDRKKFFELVLIIAAPAVVLMAAGGVMHFRILGRHFTPLMPVVLWLLSTGVAAHWSHGGWLRKLMVCGFFLLSLGSCLSLRFAARHEKDNYRDAAGFARAALQSGRQVWWNADYQGAAYYQVPTTDRPAESGKAWRVTNPSRELLSVAPVPEIIIASKADLFDNRRALAEYIAQTRFSQVATLPAFTIWQRSAK